MKIVSDLFCALLRIIFGTVVYSKGFAFENESQRIYYANHSSHLDFPLIWAALPRKLRHQTRPVAARDYWGQGGFRGFIGSRVFNSILIDRSGKGARENPLEPIHQALKDGSSVIIFPEGTRTLDGSLQKFKSGLFHLSKDRTDVEIVPVYLHNLNRILPKGELLVVPLLSRVTFGAPLQRVENETKAEFLKRAESSLEQLYV